MILTSLMGIHVINMLGYKMHQVVLIFVSYNTGQILEFQSRPAVVAFMMGSTQELTQL